MLQRLCAWVGMPGQPVRLLTSAAIIALVAAMLGVLAGFSQVPFWLGALIAAPVGGILVKRL